MNPFRRRRAVALEETVHGESRRPRPYAAPAVDAAARRLDLLPVSAVLDRPGPRPFVQAVLAAVDAEAAADAAPDYGCESCVRLYDQIDDIQAVRAGLEAQLAEARLAAGGLHATIAALRRELGEQRRRAVQAELVLQGARRGPLDDPAHDAPNPLYDHGGDLLAPWAPEMSQ